MSHSFTYYPLGDRAFIIKVGNDISVENHLLVKAMSRALEKKRIIGVSDIVPAYNEITVHYNPKDISGIKLLEELKKKEKRLNRKDKSINKIIEIPVCYSPQFAPDIEELAQHNQIEVEEVIKIHSRKEYLVYMLGFTPGFCYLGGVNPEIACPRKDIPRAKIEAGSVGIAGTQTGIYPMDSPGGWQIIGKTPLKLFDINRDPLFLIKAGDYLKFMPIDEHEFTELCKLVNDGKYTLKTTSYDG